VDCASAISAQGPSRGIILSDHESTWRSTTVRPGVTGERISPPSTSGCRTTIRQQYGAGMLRPLREREADSRESLLALRELRVQERL
jgi:hypothetical protein